MLFLRNWLLWLWRFMQISARSWRLQDGLATREGVGRDAG